MQECERIFAYQQLTSYALLITRSDHEDDYWWTNKAKLLNDQVVKGGNSFCWKRRILAPLDHFSQVNVDDKHLCVYLPLHIDYYSLSTSTEEDFEVSEYEKEKKREFICTAASRSPEDNQKICIKCGLNEQCQMSSRCLLSTSIYFTRFVSFFFGVVSLAFQKKRPRNNDDTATLLRIIWIFLFIFLLRCVPQLSQKKKIYILCVCLRKTEWTLFFLFFSNNERASHKKKKQRDESSHIHHSPRPTTRHEERC